MCETFSSLHSVPGSLRLCQKMWLRDTDSPQRIEVPHLEPSLVSSIVLYYYEYEVLQIDCIQMAAQQHFFSHHSIPSTTVFPSQLLTCRLNTRLQAIVKPNHIHFPPKIRNTLSTETAGSQDDHRVRTSSFPSLLKQRPSRSLPPIPNKHDRSLLSLRSRGCASLRPPGIRQKTCIVLALWRSG